MDSAHIGEFQKLILKFDSDAEVKDATIKGLLSIAQQGFEEINIRSIKLIGSLNIFQAEGHLLELLENNFNDVRLEELQSSPNKNLLEHQYLTSILTALILIKSEKGIKIANAVSGRFNNTWISAYLDNVHKRVGS